MKPFNVEERYEATYLYEGSRLVADSPQDKELRRAWFIAIHEIIAWMQTVPEEMPDLLVQVQFKKIETEVHCFLMKNTTEAERIKK